MGPLASYRTVCPYCGKSLRLKRPPVAGHRILCSGCQRSFAPVDAEAAVRLPPQESAFAPVPPAEPAPEPAPLQPATPAGPSRGRLLVVAGGFLALLVTATVLALNTSPAGGPEVAVSSPGPESKPADAPKAEELRASESLIDREPPPIEPLPLPQRQERPTYAPPADESEPVNLGPRLPAAVGRSELPAELQTKVNHAIDEGLKYLRNKQLVNGTWDNHHTLAMAALPALTLLECGAASDDPVVQKAARFVRNKAPRFKGAHETYELSLALLFLDRLGEEEDKPLIRTIALRLVAGQQADGGWGYALPAAYSPDEERLLIPVLRMIRPPGLQPITRDLPFEPVPERGVVRDPTKQPMPFPARQPGETQEAPNGGTVPLMGGGKPATKEEIARAVRELPAKMRGIPAIDRAVREENLRFSGRTDNSNTQFAVLALWAALKHDVPLERSLHMVEERFRTTQGGDGSWGYLANKGNRGWGTPSMTGAGLLGLAVGHGLTAKKGDKARVDDPMVHRGLEALGQHIDQGNNNFRVQPMLNLYFLWTVERVGMLYGVKMIGGKDWYRWGAEQLVAQQRNGAWHGRGYHGSTERIDTCLALLFLRRANLAADLTQRLQFVTRQ